MYKKGVLLWKHILNDEKKKGWKDANEADDANGMRAKHHYLFLEYL